jgi:Uma2 family endonuclease
MATTTSPSNAVAPEPARFVFEDVSWDDYEAMIRIVGDRPVRVTYDQGRMEIMSPTYGHENTAYLLGRLVDALSEELDIPVEGGDTATLRRKDLGRGTESDKCYWLRENCERVRGKKRLDLETDPPPDLVIEVDVTSSSIDKLPIFAALGIREVWRLENDSLCFLQLRSGGSYAEAESSLNFPRLEVGAVAQFLERAALTDKTAWIKAFRTFVRTKLVQDGGRQP